MSKNNAKILLTSICSGLTVFGGLLLYFYYKEKKKEIIEHEILMDEIADKIIEMETGSRTSRLCKSWR